MQKKIMRYPVEETAAKHERIVKEASRLFRERGFENVSVGEVMKAAGLTHGAFYAHFASKQELEKAAVAYGQNVSAGRARSYGATKKGRKAYADRYLSPRHRDNPGDGCTMAALAQDAEKRHRRRWRYDDDAVDNQIAKRQGPPQARALGCID